MSKHGIRCDESLGFPKIDYRCGIAGIFQAIDVKKAQKTGLWEIPLVIMDSALVEQYPDGPESECQRLIAHLKCLGGALTILWHPGQFCNPEFPEFRGLYRRILKVCNKFSSGGMSAIDLVHKLPGEGSISKDHLR